MNLEIMTAILDKIRASDTIMIFRHLRPDGDCMGASKGLKAILQQTYPEKQIYLTDGAKSDFLAFMGPDDPEVPEEVYARALGIVVDTATTDRISNKKFSQCRELVKIDHHIPVENYAPTCWVEEERSSACEMIVKFYDTFRSELKLSKEAATYLYTGMVTDSGRFQFRSVSGDTLRYAGLLLDQGVDTDTLYAHLYLRSVEELRFKSQVYHDMQITENGVVYIWVSQQMQQQFGLTGESASAVVSYLEHIEGCLCWLAFIEGADGEIRVRLRSRFVAINPVAQKYGGGGHACASGATVHSRQEMEQLIRDADAHVGAYKQTHEGWL